MKYSDYTTIKVCPSSSCWWALQDEWVRDQALRRLGGPPDGSKEADPLRLKLQEAQEELDATRSSLAAAEKAAADAEKALQRLASPQLLTVAIAAAVQVTLPCMVEWSALGVCVPL